MRRLIPVLLLVGVAAPAAALAFPVAAADGTLSVKRGIGFVRLTFNGSVVGRLGRVKVVITDLSGGSAAGFDLWGCATKDIGDAYGTCTGNGIRFRAIGGRYNVAIKGSGIFLSAVGRGTVLLNGNGENLDLDDDGVYSLNDAPYRNLPNEPRLYPLAGTPNG